MKKKKKIRTIAVILCDHDFYMTYTPLMETLQRAVKWNPDQDDEHIKKYILSLIEGHYWAFQFDEHSKKDIEPTIKYLKDRTRIMFDEEAEKFIENNDHDGASNYLEVIKMPYSGLIHPYIRQF